MSLRFLDVSGVGNSGKSALVDLLREFDGIWVPEYWFEFDVLRVPGGLIELRTALCDNWSPVRSHAALRAFRDVVEHMGVDPKWWDIPGLLRSTSQRYDRRFNGRFRSLSHQFADSFILGRYGAEWPYEALRDSSLERLARKVLRRLGFRRRLLRQVLLVEGREFSARATAYLQALYAGVVPTCTRWAVLNNGFEPFSPIPALDSLAGSLQLVVTRDPRDVFVSGLNAHRAGGADRRLLSSDNDGLNKSFLATDDLELFVKRYRLYHAQLYCGTDPRVMRIRFEDLVHDYAQTLGRITAFLGLDAQMHRRMGQHFSPARSGANVGLWRSYSLPEEITYIERELAEYLVHSP